MYCTEPIYTLPYISIVMKEQKEQEYNITVKIPIKGYFMVEKVAGKSGNSAYLYLPAKWAGKKVAVVLLEGFEE